MDKLITLPWQIQLVLASGYSAYALSYVGIRSHHSNIEIAFCTLTFGMITFLSLFAFYTLIYENLFWGSIFAFVATVAFGLVWRKWGRKCLRDLIRRMHVSQADDDPSAWHAMFDVTEFDVAQISVRLTDGRWLRCDDTRLFADAPFGPCVLGGSGDLIMYSTHTQSTDGEVKEHGSTLHPMGARLSYVPKESISYVNIRHSKSSRR